MNTGRINLHLVSTLVRVTPGNLLCVPQLPDCWLEVIVHLNTCFLQANTEMVPKLLLRASHAALHV